jgi:chromosomal replication initiator protein
MSEEVVRAPGVDSILASQWAQVRGRLRSEFGEATFRSWLKPLTLLGQSDCQVSIAVKTRFMRDWITQHYAERIRALWHAANPEIRGIEFVVDANRPQAMKAQHLTAERVPAAPEPGRAEPGRAEPARGETHPAATFAPEDVSAPLDPRFTFENFIVGSVERARPCRSAARSPRRAPCPSTRSSSMAGSGWARPI